MKTEWFNHGVIRALVALGLAAWSSIPALGQDHIYAARVSSVSLSVWDPPFYWIANGGPAYATAQPTSTATNPVSTPYRVGSYFHTASTMVVGEGYGLIHNLGTTAGDGEHVVYEVDVTLPDFNASTNIVMNVGSTNCDLGGVFGATAAGGWTNTTAFQSAYCANVWGFACYLTNRPGVTQPHIDFKYVSGDDGRNYADCIRFHLLSACCSNVLTSVRITNCDGAALQYAGGSATRFVLLKSARLSTALDSWTRVATNFVTPGAFTISTVGTDAPVFYGVKSE